MRLVILVLGRLRQEDHELGLCNEPKNKGKKSPIPPHPKKNKQRVESVLHKIGMWARDVSAPRGPAQHT